MCKDQGMDVELVMCCSLGAFIRLHIRLHVLQFIHKVSFKYKMTVVDLCFERTHVQMSTLGLN